MFTFLMFIIMGPLAILFFIWGYQLRRGKWLKSLAGNNFDEFSKEKVEKLGKSSGILLYLSGLFCISLGFVPFLGRNYRQFILFLIGIITIVSLFLVINSLSDWIKND